MVSDLLRAPAQRAESKRRAQEHRIRGAPDLKLARWLDGARRCLSSHDHFESDFQDARGWMRERRREERAALVAEVKRLEEEVARRAAQRLPPGT